MTQLVKVLTIAVPSDRVFRFINNPANFLRYCPNAIGIEEIQEFSGFKKRFLWKYKLMGVRFHGVAQTTHCQYGRCIETETRGGILSKVVWHFSATGALGDHTCLTLEIDYHVPKPLLSRFTADEVIRQNERDVDDMLVQLKAVLEGKLEALSVAQ